MDRVYTLALQSCLMGAAHEIRTLRRHARALKGAQGHRLRMYARDHLAIEVRALNILYGYVRGRSIEQIESSITRNPVSLSCVERCFKQHAPAWRLQVQDLALVEVFKALRERILADLGRWNAAIQQRELERSKTVV